MKGITKDIDALTVSTILLLAIGLTATACESGSDQITGQSPGRDLNPVTMSSHNGLTKVPISGTISRTGNGFPGRIVATAGGICHLFDIPIHAQSNGDLVGPITYYENIHQKCSGGRLIGNGPFEGTITWNGRTGTINGQFTTNCKPDPSTVSGVACDGVINARGSGELEGVRFHYEWGPGWWPFSYSGTAFAK